jgi:hypothetical protein
MYENKNFKFSTTEEKNIQWNKRKEKYNDTRIFQI